MSFKDLREFISLLEQEGELKRITAESIPIWRSQKLLIAVCETAARLCCSKIQRVRLFPCLPIFLAIPSESHWLWDKRSGGSARRWQTAGVFEGTLAPEGLARFMAELAQLQKRPEHASGGSKNSPCQEL